MDGFVHRSTLRNKQNVEEIVKESEIINNLCNVRIADSVTTDVFDSDFKQLAEAGNKYSGVNLLSTNQDLQTYVKKLCNEIKNNDEACLGGEDSSYDSDFEGEELASHQNVSRTASDTLAAEFSEYVSETSSQSTNYTAKIEFGLKLGYTEKHVQAALDKLGPNPSQNELLAELIKLGAQSKEFSKPPELEPEISSLEDGLNHEGNAVKLRPIVIDGSNVAMSHGNKEVFSCRGIKICVDWFKNRGHREITVFVPKWRKEASRPDNLISDQEILNELEKERIVVFTPSRLLGGRRTICYDDRYILRLAIELDGIVVSNDNYRDLAQENIEFRKVIEERTLMYSFVNDRFMPPDDPLGRSGPTLDNFLKTQPKRTDPPPPCPYGKKCTYGNKCKYGHPERGSMPHKSVTERLVEHAQKHWQARGNRDSCKANMQIKGKSLSVPLSMEEHTKQLQQQGTVKKTPLTRTKSGHPPCSSTKPFNFESFSVSKSKSVENILNDKVLIQVARKSNKVSDRHYLQPPGQSNFHASADPRFSDSEPDSNQTRANLHRKLERQLTLNPYEGTTTHGWGMYATGVHLDGSYWKHQNLTRISSAPGSCLPMVSMKPNAQRQMHRMNSTSDSHINLCVPEVSNFSVEPMPWIPVSVPGTCSSNVNVCVSPPPSQIQHPFDPHSKEEARKKLHYHLSSIFPEEHVRTALQMHPNETKPQEICAAILAMFPNQ